MIKTTFTSIVLVFAAHTSINLERDETPQRFTFSEPHMGTTFQIILYAPNKETASKAAKSAFARIAELNQIMSDYLRDSELMQLCKQAGGAPKRVSADLYHILDQAQRLAKQTDGAFDVTVGPIVRLWRRARRTRKLPSAEQLKETLAKVGYNKIALKSHKRLVQLLVMGMLLDLGGIAKGYAADEALEVLRGFGIRSALINAGGDITVGDAPPNRNGWKIAVAPLKKPDGEPSQFLLLKNASVATSGDASQYVEIKGARYSHIVDPKTGLGLVGRRSVTVIAPNGTAADSLATAVCVLGPKRGMQLIESTKGTAALYIYENDNRLVTIRSKRFDRYKTQPLLCDARKQGRESSLAGTLDAGRTFVARPKKTPDPVRRTSTAIKRRATHDHPPQIPRRIRRRHRRRRNDRRRCPAAKQPSWQDSPYTLRR